MAQHLLPNFRIAIVGSGAIGRYYGGKLAPFGRDVHFLMRSDYEAVRKSGLRIRSKTENIHVAKVNVHQTTAEIGPCDLVIVAVKTTSNTDLPALLPPLLHERTMLLSLQNGLGNEEFLAHILVLSGSSAAFVSSALTASRLEWSNVMMTGISWSVNSIVIRSRAHMRFPGNSNAAELLAAWLKI